MFFKRIRSWSLYFCILLNICNGENEKKMKVGVIGAGASGLVALKNLLDNGIDCVAFERANVPGGTWVYSEDLVDVHGLPTPSAMYKNLRTNLPKELMLFDGLHYKVVNESFIHHKTVLQYLNEYINEFHLEPFIKFESLVKNVRYKENKWELSVVNLRTKQVTTYTFDAIFVTNGHYSEPQYPKIDGQKEFQGLEMHSFNYRKPEVFTNMTVLVVGGGPSGIDISYDLAPIVKKVLFSHHGENFELPENVIRKPDVSVMHKNSVTFKDGSESDIDAVIYCTGYNYYFPFLDESCGVKVDDNYVYPLFKQFISIEHPSMVFIGLPLRTFIFPLLEVQVKAFINVLLEKVQLPGKDEMLKETHQLEEMHKSKGRPKNKYHVLGLSASQYVMDLIKFFKVDPIPEVIYKIYGRTAQIRATDLKNYRNYMFHIIDDKNFKEEKVHSS